MNDHQSRARHGFLTSKEWTRRSLGMTSRRPNERPAGRRSPDSATTPSLISASSILAERAGGDAPQRVAAWTERLAGSGASAKMTEPF